MSRDYRLYLDDILEACQKIRLFTDGMSFRDFEQDVKTQDAVMRNFEMDHALSSANVTVEVETHATTVRLKS